MRSGTLPGVDDKHYDDVFRQLRVAGLSRPVAEILVAELRRLAGTEEGDRADQG